MAFLIFESPAQFMAHTRCSVKKEGRPERIVSEFLEASGQSQHKGCIEVTGVKIGTGVWVWQLGVTEIS